MARPVQILSAGAARKRLKRDVLGSLAWAAVWRGGGSWA
jgi:hypothetical protein